MKLLSLLQFAPFTLWIPPIHELGHVLITWAAGDKLLSVTFDHMTHTGGSQWYWDAVTIIIPFVTAIIIMYKYYRKETKRNELQNK